MNDSQCLDDWPAGRQGLSSGPLGQGVAVGLEEVYSESHRLALEVLVARGEEAYTSFLHRERVQPFLSSEEISHILRATISPSTRESGCEALDQSLDCSTGTYFPEASDVEVPVLDLGWPTYPDTWYRGVTRVDVHFQPSYGEVIYPCKEAVRTLIRKAKKVIALVMDSFTDIDIFKDIHEACSRRMIPVYIILDHSGLPQFQQMCQNAGVWLETERKLRVRTITGCTYYTRTGARIIGKANEKFMLIDGDKVATGSYSFTWTDGKLNRSNLTVLSGQVSEFYDEEFRMLYAQSKPITPKSASPSKRGVCKETAGKAKEPLAIANVLEQEEVTCSPSEQKPGNNELQIEDKLCLQISKKRSHVSEASTLGDQALLEEEDVERKEMKSVSTQTEEEEPLVTRGTATQTCVSANEQATQTASPLKSAAFQMAGSCRSTVAQTEMTSASGRQAPTEKQVIEDPPASSNQSACSKVQPLSNSSSDNSSRSSRIPFDSEDPIYLRSCTKPTITGFHGANSTLRHSFLNLTKERRYHYSNIRSKLDDMFSILSRRRDVIKYQGREPGKYALRSSNDLVNRNGFVRLRDMPLLASMALRN
uniref:Protein FAM83D n=1 Tax=Callorhinchus milii TaxID=7868 RepID=V9KLQ6_CALMI